MQFIIAAFFIGLAIGLGGSLINAYRMRKNSKKSNDLWSAACRSWMEIAQKARDENLVMKTLMMNGNVPYNEHEVPDKRLLN